MKDDAWRLKVLSTIGGSSAGAVLGSGRFTSPRQVWERIVRARAGLLDPERRSDDLHRGNVFEAPCREQTALLLKRDIRPHPQDQFIESADKPWGHCLPDGWLDDGGIFEGKVPRPQTVAKIRAKGLFPEWIIQYQHNLAFTGAPYLVSGILDVISGRPEVVTIQRDEPFIAEILEREERFWNEHVIPNIPPADTPVAYLDEGNGEIVRLTEPDQIRAAENYARLYALVDETEELLKQAKIRLAEVAGSRLEGDKLIGGPDAFEVPGVVRIYHRASAGRKTFDKDKAIAKYPDLRGSEYFKQTAPSRSFKTYLLGELD